MRTRKTKKSCSTENIFAELFPGLKGRNKFFFIIVLFNQPLPSLLSSHPRSHLPQGPTLSCLLDLLDHWFGGDKSRTAVASPQPSTIESTSSFLPSHMLFPSYVHSVTPAASSRIFCTYWKGNFPMSPLCPSVCWSVGRSVCLSGHC